jgi:hypothetical protein
MVAYVRAT